MTSSTTQSDEFLLEASTGSNRIPLSSCVLVLKNVLPKKIALQTDLKFHLKLESTIPIFTAVPTLRLLTRDHTSLQSTLCSRRSALVITTQVISKGRVPGNDQKYRDV